MSYNFIKETLFLGNANTFIGCLYWRFVMPLMPLHKAREQTAKCYRHFQGKIPSENGYYTGLILRHCQYCDDGTFTLQETKKESEAWR